MGARIGAGRGPVAFAVAGFAADLVAESVLIAIAPDRPELARPSFALTGGVANGLYTLAGALLTLRTPGLRGPFATWTWAVWGAGAALSAAALIEAPLLVAAASACSSSSSCRGASRWAAGSHETRRHRRRLA